MCQHHKCSAKEILKTLFSMNKETNNDKVIDTAPKSSEDIIMRCI